jgi:hypothetical protein
MRPDESVVADLAGGVVLVGRTVVETSSAGAGGELRFAGGTVLRPLRFGERTTVVTEASGRGAARDAVAAAVLAAATVERGSGDRTLLETLALWMAGAAWDAPPFAEAALAVGRAGSWSLQDLLMTPAAEVDRLAVHIAGQQRNGEWNAIIFGPAPAPDVPSVRARFAGQLLRRVGREAAAVEEPAAVFEPSSGSAPSASAQATESQERWPLPHLRQETRGDTHSPQRSRAGVETGTSGKATGVQRGVIESRTPANANDPPSTRTESAAREYAHDTRRTIIESETDRSTQAPFGSSYSADDRFGRRVDQDLPAGDPSGLESVTRANANDPHRGIIERDTHPGTHDPHRGGPELHIAETHIAETLSHTPTAAPVDGAEQPHDAEAQSARIASGRTGPPISSARSRWRASAVTRGAKGSTSVNPDTQTDATPPATAPMTPPAAPRLTLPPSTAADRHPEPFHAATLDAFTLPDVFVTTTQLLLHEAASRPAHESRPLTPSARALPAAGSSADEVARTLARMLEDEADLRGVER